MREELVLVSGIARNLFWNEEGGGKADSPYTNKISGWARAQFVTPLATGPCSESLLRTWQSV